MIGLTYIMKLENITAKELATRLGVTASTISQWESKKRPIPKERRVQLSQIFPMYPEYYYEIEISERDAIMLQNAQIINSIEKLRSKDDFESIKKRRILANKRENNIQLLQQKTITDKIESTLQKTYELSFDDSLLVRKNLIADFSILCEIEDELIKSLLILDEDKSKYKQFKSDLYSKIKFFIDEIKDHIDTIYYIHEYNIQNKENDSDNE